MVDPLLGPTATGQAMIAVVLMGNHSTVEEYHKILIVAAICSLALYNQTQIHFLYRDWPRSIGDCFQSLHLNGHRFQVNSETI